MSAPRLPVTELRAAIQAEEWTAAANLLADHQAAMSQALARVDLATEPRQAWEDLLTAHQAMLAELTIARDHTAELLKNFGTNHRVAHAYLHSGAQ